MKKLLIYLIAAVSIVFLIRWFGWWVLPVTCIILVAWSIFRVNKEEKPKRETPVIPMED